MRLIFFIIILTLIAVIPNGIWVSIGIFLIYGFFKIKNLKVIQIETIHHRKQNEYDDEILEEMK